MTAGTLCMGLMIGFAIGLYAPIQSEKANANAVQKDDDYWFLLHRKSGVELLYKGVSGNALESKLVRSFQVKTGAEGKPTPLPQLYGRQYWEITKKYETRENFETAPYFLELNIPYGQEAPYGPVPYKECNGQCNWELPGPFGLHGVNADNSRLSKDNPGSSGCIRHTDTDITYLYSIIEPENNVRYYIQDI